MDNPTGIQQQPLLDGGTAAATSGNAAAATQSQKPNWRGWHTAGLFVTLLFIGIIGFTIPVGNILWIWLFTLLFLVIFSMIAGSGITGRWLGWMIDEEYTMSLSRLQMFLWTVVVLSGFITAVFVNIRTGHYDDALNIAIPEQLWLAMGISTTSLVGSPLILNTKRGNQPNKNATTITLTQRGLLNDSTNDDATNQAIKDHSSGQLYKNTDPKEANFSDLVRGEETSNANTLDLTRLQNLFFTLILVGSYTVALGSYLATQAAIPSFPLKQFPQLGDSSVALLAISHAGYLIAKATPKQNPGDT